MIELIIKSGIVWWLNSITGRKGEMIFNMTGGKRKIEKLQCRRIKEKLRDIFDSELFIVKAMTGYGKTTAVYEFLKERDDINTVWISAYFYEEDDSWIWKKFCDSVKKENYCLGEELYKKSIPQNNFDIDNIIDLLKSIIKSTTVFVFDDWEQITSIKINKFIERLVCANIPYLHIVLITRENITNNYVKYEIENKCSILHQEHLAFTNDEIKEFFHINGYEVNEEETEKIYEYTLGWPAAICCLAENCDFKDDIIGSLSKCIKLINTMIYEKISEKEKNIFLKLSLLDEFTIKQAAYVTGEKESEALIKQFQEKDLFVYYDSSFHTYKFHPLFKNLLNSELENSCINSVEIYNKLIMWFLNEGNFSSAVEYVIYLKYNGLIGRTKEDFNSFMSAFEGQEYIGDDLFLYIGNSLLSMFHKNKGGMKESLQIVQENIFYFTDFGGCGTAGLEYLLNGEYLYEIGQFKDAQKMIYKAINEAELGNQKGIYICANFVLMKILLVMGRKDTLYVKINELDEYVKQNYIENSKFNIQSAYAYIWGIIGIKDKIPQWIKKISLNLSCMNNIDTIFIPIGILLILEKKYKELIILSDRMIKNYNRKKNIIGEIYAHIYSAAAKYNMNQLKDSGKAFMSAVKLAEKDNIVMPFIELSSYIMELIKENKSDFMKTIIKYISDLKVIYYGNIPERKYEVDELTCREIEVMKLICCGRTQSNIASDLNVSINTVRYHVKNIYEKLGVQNKTLAIQKYNSMKF